MIRLDALSDAALGILNRLLSDDPVVSWICQSLAEELKARPAGQHAPPLAFPLAMKLPDAQILNRHLIAAAHTLEDLAWQPHGDNAPDEPFLEGARFLALISEELGQCFRPGPRVVN